jgi:hypothetical protein
VVITYTAGDSEPGFEFTIYDRDGQPLDLTTATAAEFRAKLTTGSTLVDRSCTFVDRANGRCLATWATATDLATIGIYNVQVRVTWATGRWSSHPNDTYDALVIQREVQA